MLLAIPAALSGTLGLWAYYRGMAVGAMSVVAPIAGISAIVPVTVGLATGDDPSAAQIAGIFVALIGVGLASREHQAGDAPRGRGRRTRAPRCARLRRLLRADARRRRRGLLVGVARLPHDVVRADRDCRARGSPLGSHLAPRRRTTCRRSGIGDTLGNVLFAASASHGLVSVTSVLASLYPVVTVVLARVVLHERVDRLQDAGIVAMLAGVVLISAG